MAALAFTLFTENYIRTDLKNVKYYIEIASYIGCNIPARKLRIKFILRQLY